MAKKLYVGGLPYSADENQLRQLFEQQMINFSQQTKETSMADLAKEMSELKRNIDVNFSKLDRVTTDHDEKDKLFAKKLAELEPKAN